MDKIKQNPLHISLFSFFSGIGILDLGFENSGIPVSFVNEIRQPFLDAYKYSRKILRIKEPRHGYHQGSIEDLINGDKRNRLKDMIREDKQGGKIIGFIGGPPCPDFSVGGKNRGHTGDNGRLTQTYFELILKYRPDFFLFENVKGLWQTKRHRAFYLELKEKVKNAGYSVTDRLINTIEYRTPQDRDRIILWGFSPRLLNIYGKKNPKKGNLSLVDVFPWQKKAAYPGRGAFDYPWPKTAPFHEDSNFDCPEGLPQELTVEYWFRKNDVYHHPNSTHHFKPKAGLARFTTVDEGDDKKKSYKRLHRWRYSPTVCYGNNEVHLHPYKARRISAAESLALQSLPKEFSLPDDMTLSNMFKAIGNGVPYLAAYALAGMLIDFLGGKNEGNG